MENIKFDSKTKVLFYGFSGFLALSVVFSAYQFIAQRNFVIYGMGVCDPEVNSCFVHVCDPDEEECADDKPRYFYIVAGSAKYYPECNPTFSDCPVMSCSDLDTDCSATFCDESMVDEYGECS